MIPAPIPDPDDIKRFLHAGRAVFTLVSKATGARYTYRARQGDHVLFIDLLTAPDTFTYIGIVRLHAFNPMVRKDDPRPAPAKPCGAFAWFMQSLYQAPERLSQLEFWHAGTCAKCGRMLTDPASIARGLGPKCAETTHA